MAFLLLATFVTVDFILNINSILFILESGTVGYRFYSEPSWLESISFQLNDNACGLASKNIDIIYQKNYTTPLVSKFRSFTLSLNLIKLLFLEVKCGNMLGILFGSY